ncbi:MAG: hypothetical protein ACON4R_02525 [Akkermansiaceae bacterium]
MGGESPRHNGSIDGIDQLLRRVVFFGLVSCSSSIRSFTTPEPTEAGAKLSGKSYTSLKKGYGVYLKHCAQCHEHRPPNTVTLPAWYAKTNTLSELAGLSKEERESLQLYLGEFSDR